jgi:hypothetical protein
MIKENTYEVIFDDACGSEYKSTKVTDKSGLL